MTVIVAPANGLPSAFLTVPAIDCCVASRTTSFFPLLLTEIVFAIILYSIFLSLKIEFNASSTEAFFRLTVTRDLAFKFSL
ncbi:hypothetical protein D3C72_1965810 [compost metagenome]